MGKYEGNRAISRPKRRWEDNIKIYLQEVRCEGVDWFELAQVKDRWRACECCNEPSGSVKCGEFLD